MNTKQLIDRFIKTGLIVEREIVEEIVGKKYFFKAVSNLSFLNQNIIIV